MLNLESFKARLIQTIRWCESRVSPTHPADSLRTFPIAINDGFIDMLHEERIELVHDLISKREQQLEIEKGPSERPVQDLGSGKLLLFYPDGSLFDGAAMFASAGFFDCDNVPAWDTWVYYGRDSSGTRENCDVNFLVSWIPHTLIKHINAGIDVNPESCIEWASKVDRAFTRSLRKSRLLY